VAGVQGDAHGIAQSCNNRLLSFPPIDCHRVRLNRLGSLIGDEHHICQRGIGAITRAATKNVIEPNWSHTVGEGALPIDTIANVEETELVDTDMDNLNASLLKHCHHPGLLPRLQGQPGRVKLVDESMVLWFCSRRCGIMRRHAHPPVRNVDNGARADTLRGRVDKDAPRIRDVLVERNSCGSRGRAQPAPTHASRSGFVSLRTGCSTPGNLPATSIPARSSAPSGDLVSTSIHVEKPSSNCLNDNVINSCVARVSGTSHDLKSKLSDLSWQRDHSLEPRIALVSTLCPQGDQASKDTCFY